jgi:hypothetical protein
MIRLAVSDRSPSDLASGRAICTLALGRVTEYANIGIGDFSWHVMAHRTVRGAQRLRSIRWTRFEKERAAGCLVASMRSRPDHRPRRARIRKCDHADFAGMEPLRSVGVLPSHPPAVTQTAP